MHSNTMRLSIVFLGLLALAAAVPTQPRLLAADQVLLQKQQNVISLLENILGQLPNQHLYEIGVNYEFQPNLQNYENPSVVQYYLGLVKTGHVQPQGTPYSYSVSQLRKEVGLLTQILLGAKDYQTFLNTAAWARVNVNQEQFVTAFSNAVIQRPDMYGVILPPAYEVYPHYFFDTRIIQKVQDLVNQVGVQGQGGIYTINVNYTSGLPYGENQIAYFTEDIGLSAYYSYVQLASYMLPTGQTVQGGYKQGSGQQGSAINGHGTHYYYIHQQLLARYNLERLGQGLSPIQELDNYYQNIETPYTPNLRYSNGVNLPARNEHVIVTPGHHNYELIKLVRTLEQRILDAIALGQVITPSGAFLSLYQPQGLDILGEIIEGTGHSVNPRYYGSFQYVAKQLLGNAPAFNNIWEYTPSALELGQTAVRDPIFYQLFNKIIELFHYYQEALPAYQYNDVVVPGVSIQKVEVSDLVTYFSNYQVNLNNAIPQPVGQQQQQQPFPTVQAQLKRLDHKQYQYTIYVQAEKVVPGAVVRVYVGPKYNYDGQPIDINVHRHYFYEIDQFVQDITEGQNVIVRNSQQATGQSLDWPSIQQLTERVQGALRSQNPLYINYPEQLYGFPARLSLPKGSQSGYPLQLLVVITSGIQHQPSTYGPILEEEWMTYQSQHYQIVGQQEYQQSIQNPIDPVTGGYQTIEVIPEYSSQVVTEGNWHWGYLYKKYPGSYYYPHWQQQYYNNVQGGVGQQGILSGVQQGTQQGGMYGNQYGQLYGQSGKQGITGGKVSGMYQQQVGVQTQQSGQGVYGQGLYGQGQIGQGQIGQGQVGQGVYGQSQVGKGLYGQGQVGKGLYGQGQVEQGVYGLGQTGQGLYGQGQVGQGIYTGSVSGKGQEQYLSNYYQNQYIGNIIGGALSLDGKPLGYPLDRQLAESVFYARNIYVQDVVVYHDDEYIPEY